jgi:hypothetical protein
MFDSLRYAGAAGRPWRLNNPHRSDRLFNVGVRYRGIPNRVDLDVQHAQLCEPTVQAEQRIIIVAKVFRYGLSDLGAMEHAAHGHAIDACEGDTKADDSTTKDIRDQHRPMPGKEDRFNPERIRASGGLSSLPAER